MYYPVYCRILCYYSCYKLYFSDRRFTDTATNRVVNAPTVRIQEPKTNGTNGVNAAEVSEALTNGKSKKKAYRR